MEEFIKSAAILGWIIALVIISTYFFIASIVQKKSDQGDRWFSIGCVSSFFSMVIAVSCGLALFEEAWISLGKRFMLYLFFIALTLTCFIIGRYKLNKKADHSPLIEKPIEKKEPEQEEPKEMPKEDEKAEEPPKQEEKQEEKEDLSAEPAKQTEQTNIQQKKSGERIDDNDDWI